MACPKPTMEFFFNENRSVESTTDTSDNFSLSSTPKPHLEFRGSLYKPKFDPMSPYSGLAGRASPGHDLGYHTLLTRDSVTPTPTHTPTAPRRTYDSLSCSSSSFRWSNVPSPMCNTSPYPRTSDMMTPPPPPRNHSASLNTPSTHSSSVSTARSSTMNGSSHLLDTNPLVTTFKGKKSHKNSLFDKLSDDLILKIFSFLSSNHLCVCARVCRRWYFLAWEPQLWTTVCLSSEKIHVDRGLKTLFRLLCRDSPTVCLAVERISLNGCCRLTDKGLLTIARKCPELKTLEIRGCALVTNSGIAEVTARCANILRLDLTGCQQVTTIQPRNLANERTDSVLDHPSSMHLPHVIHHHQIQLFLQFLDLTDCHGLEDFGLKTIVRNSPQISHLYLRRCVQITDCGIKAIASFCMMLKELSISDCILVTDFGMYELAKLGSNLRYLSVAKCDQISDAGIKQIARHCYKLRYLNVRGCEAVSDHSMEVLARSCPRLRALDIGKCDVTDNGLRLLSEHCPNLRKLSVKSCDIITDQGIQAIAFYCRGLQQLNIQDCNITIEGYRTVKKFCKRCIIEHTNPGFY